MVSSDEINKKLKNKRERIREDKKPDDQIGKIEGNSRKWRWLDNATGFQPTNKPSDEILGKECSKCKSRNPDDVTFCIKCGNILKDEREDPDDPKNKVLNEANKMIEEGKKYFSKRFFPKSAECFDKAIEIDPNSSEAYYWKGEILFVHKDYARALLEFNSALTHNPNNVKALQDKGACLFNLGEYEESLEYFEKAECESETHQILWYNKGLALKKLNKNLEGDECLKKFIKIAPSKMKNQKNIAKQLVKGKIHINTLISDTPRNPMIEISFYETMPERVSLNNNKSYIKGILEIGEKEIIIHKRSLFRGKDRGTKHIRYDKITSIDYDKGKLLAPQSIQVYLSNVEYSFRSPDVKLKSFYDIIRKKIDESQAIEKNIVSNVSAMDELKKLHELKVMGVVTEEEFELKKKQLLNL